MTQHKTASLMIILLRYIINAIGTAMSLLVLREGILGLLTGRYNRSFVLTVQMLYLLEIVFSLIGITKQNILASILQTASRIFVAYYLCNTKYTIITSLMYLCWGISDSLRFLYYSLHKFKSIRYYTSYILYPVGVFCEVFLMIYCYKYTSLIGILIYIPGFIYLYGNISKRIDRKNKSKKA
ncbi:very-long-chain (3R)-3-hydroxyacyl-CoA dehydratase [Nematocida sp. AWRm80]|nr:very-long-chain (3R)-3-hydroxyacyl-CoA dehydratase [Nematocida sp. AWRm80]